MIFPVFTSFVEFLGFLFHDDFHKYTAKQTAPIVLLMFFDFTALERAYMTQKVDFNDPN